MAEMLRGVNQRLTDGERSWESEKRGLEGQLNRNLHSLRECQATADQLRSASHHSIQFFLILASALSSDPGYTPERQAKGRIARRNRLWL